jgi:hypothetical protein
MVEERDRYARAVVERVDGASPSRVEPPCPYVAAGCGGCSWRHIAPRAAGAQAADRRGALTRAGGVAGAVVGRPRAAHRGLPHHRPAWPSPMVGPGTQAALARGRPRRRLPRRPPGLGPPHRRCPVPGRRRGGAALLRGDRRAAGPGPPRGAAAARRPPSTSSAIGAWLTEEVAGRSLRSRSARSSRPAPTARGSWSPPWRRRPATTSVGDGRGRLRVSGCSRRACP